MKTIHGQCPRYDSRWIKNDTKDSHLLNCMFQNAFTGNVPLTFMGVEMLLFDNSVLKNYLLNNTQLYFHITSFNYFIFLFASYNNLSEVYDKKINIWPFQYHPGYHPSISCWYRVHIMIHGLIWKKSFINLLIKNIYFLWYAM